MVIAFANNQTLVGKDAVPVIIYTDPVSLDGYDRGTANLMVHSFWAQGSVTKEITHTAQVSNDGTNWVDTSLTRTETGTTADPVQDVSEVHGAFIRFKFTLSLSGGTTAEVGAVTFDLHVLLDHT